MLPQLEAPAPTVADAVLQGRDLRMLHKPPHRDPFVPVLPPPRPARPVCPACTQAVAGTSSGGGRSRRPGGSSAVPKQHCRHIPRAVCSNRLAVMSRPQRRHVLSIVEEHGHTLPPEKLQRFRDLLVEETTFMPDEAYDYFLFLRKARKNYAKLRRRRKSVKMQELCRDEKLAWARDATVVLARGVQKRLLKPASYHLTGGMLALSDVVLQEMCRKARRAPARARCDTRPKERFLLDLSDKILTDSDERMLMVDVDEDEDVLRAEAEGNDYADMMGATYEKGPAFAFLLEKMRVQNDRLLYFFGGVKRTYAAAADELEESPDLRIITSPSKELADRIRTSLRALVASETPSEMQADMNGVLHYCPVFLSQKAVEEAGGPEELARRQRQRAQNYVKGDAFHLLVNSMREEKSIELYDFGGVQRSYEQAADELASSKNLVTGTANGQLAEQIRNSLTALMSPLTPNDLQDDMLETLEHAPNYLSQRAVDEAGGPEALARRQRQLEEANSKPFVKGAAFDLLVTQMIHEKGKQLYHFGGVRRTYEQAAGELVQSPDLKVINPNKELAAMIRNCLTALMDPVTPAKLQEDMKVALLRVPNFLSQRAVDEAGGSEMLAQRQRADIAATAAGKALVKGAAFDLLVEKMKSEKGRELYTLGDLQQTYQQGGDFLETTNLNVTHPNEELANKIRNSLTKLMNTATPADLHEEMKVTLVHAPNILSQKAVDAAGGPEQLARLMRESAESKGRVTLEHAPNLLSQRAIDEAGGPGELARRQKEAANNKVRGSDETMRKLKAADAAGGPEELTRRRMGAANNDTGGTDELTRKLKLTDAADGPDELTKKNKPADAAGGPDELTRKQKPADAAGAPDDLMRKVKSTDAGSASQEEAQQLLVSKLKGAGRKKLVDTPTSVVHTDTAGGWLTDRQQAVAEAVRSAPETGRMAVKFERNLLDFMGDKTPGALADPMQAAIVGSSRTLSEQFVLRNFYEAVRIITITEMQKRGDTALIELNGVTESCFFAAQRLKKAADNLTTEAANPEVAAFLRNKIEQQVKCHTPRKYTSVMKEYATDASMYLSERVTQPDKDIEAYVLLLHTLEDEEDESFIITENFKMSYADAAQHLRALLTFEDELSLPNASLKTELDGKLRNLVALWHPSDSGPTMDGVISATTPLLVSHVMAQGEYDDVLKTLVGCLKEKGDRCLLIFGDVRKSYGDAAQLLAPMHAYELPSLDASPILSTKLEIKLRQILENKSATELSSFAKSILKNASQFLAVKFVEPDAVNICCCARRAQRHVGNVQEAESTPFTDPTTTLPSGSFTDKVSKCPAPTCYLDGKRFQTSSPTVEHVQIIHRRTDNRITAFQTAEQVQVPCQFLGSERFSSPHSGSGTSGSSNIFNRFRSIHSSVNRSPTCLSRSVLTANVNSRRWCMNESFTKKHVHTSDSSESPQAGTTEAVSKSLLTTTNSFPSFLICQHTVSSIDSQYSSMSPDPDAISPSMLSPGALSPGALSPGALSPVILGSCMDTSASRGLSPLPWSDEEVDAVTECIDETGAPLVVNMDQMLEWSGVMMSLMWNVRGWRRWLQSVVKRLTDLRDPKNEKEKWEEFKSHVDCEVSQWREHNLLSRMFAQRVASKCKDRKSIPNAQTMERNSEYETYQQETMHIIDMFEQWMQWLTDIVKETDSLLLAQSGQSSPDLQYHEALWSYFKGKIEQNAEDLRKYDDQMKLRWEENYQYRLSGLFSRRGVESVGDSPGVVRPAAAAGTWVPCAGGGVPAGACRAGEQRGEAVWVARATHRPRGRLAAAAVLPTALVPSKRCCLLYSGGSVYAYTNYEVLCHTSARWVALSGEGAAEAVAAGRAVAAARGVLVGRVRLGGSHLVGPVLPPAYRCHVAVGGRQRAADTYEMLVSD